MSFWNQWIPATEFRRALTNAGLASGLDMQEIETTLNSAHRGIFES